MGTRLAILAGLCLALAGSAASQAEEVAKTADAASSDKDFSDSLRELGYRDAKSVNSEYTIFNAYDKYGSEVIITVGPEDGNIVSVVYVHPSDQ